MPHWLIFAVITDFLINSYGKNFPVYYQLKAPFTLEINFELISKFMSIISFRKKISSVNSQLSIEINLEILFRNLEHVLSCEISQKKFPLWNALIGQSASIYKHRTKRRLRRGCWLSKV